MSLYRLTIFLSIFSLYTNYLYSANPDDVAQLNVMMSLDASQNHSLDLRGHDFTHLKVLKNVKLKNADLRCANFKGMDISGVDFSGADLRNANFSEARLRGVNFYKADLRGAHFSRVDARGIFFERARMKGAYLQNGSFVFANFYDCDLRCADLSNADLTGANMGMADMSCSKREGLKREGSVFYKTRRDCSDDQYKACKAETESLHTHTP